MLPVYEALISDFESGIYKISLVDLPAVESNWMKFSEDKVTVNYNIQDEEQRIVFGVLMRADFNIYRRDEQRGEFFIRYSKDTIKLMAEKMLSDGVFNNINLFHQADSDVEGVNLLEIFIKDRSKGIDPVGFETIEDGSLFCSYKVENDEIWEAIKLGVFKGFSLEGVFNIELVTNKKYNSNNFMSKLSKKICDAILAFGSVKTDKGELFWVGEAPLEVGDELFQDSEDSKVKVEDGVYTTEDGTVITVTEGLVEQITETEKESELDSTDTPDETEVEAQDVPLTDPEVKEEADDHREEDDRLWEAIKNNRDEIEKLKEIIEKISKETPAPVAEEFENAKTTKLGKINKTLQF